VCNFNTQYCRPAYICSLVSKQSFTCAAKMVTWKVGVKLKPKPRFWKAWTFYLKLYKCAMNTLYFVYYHTEYQNTTAALYNATLLPWSFMLWQHFFTIWSVCFSVQRHWHDACWATNFKRFRRTQSWPNWNIVQALNWTDKETVENLNSRWAVSRSRCEEYTSIGLPLRHSHWLYWW
jgi:hypothetical protein